MHMDKLIFVGSWLIAFMLTVYFWSSIINLTY